MDITDEDVERYLTLIFTGQKLTRIDDKLFMFKQPDNRIKALSELVYDDSYNRAVETGMLPADKLREIIKERQLFSDRDQEKLDGLYNQQKAQQILLSRTTKVKARQDRLKGIIEKIQVEIDELEHKKNSTLSISAETKAAEEKALYLCWECTYVELKEGYVKYWPSFDAMLNESDMSTRNEVLIQFLKFRSGIPTRIIRHIARHSLWRIRYVTSQKTSEHLFGVPTSEYTNDMLNLCYWSNYYQNIYEMMPKDRPGDSIIEDDEALDAFMKSFYEERNREDAAARAQSQNAGSRGTLSAFSKEEVIVTQSNELYEDIDYDKPREAQKIKDKTAVTKTAKGHRVR